jgi:hypothetical protein
VRQIVAEFIEEYHKLTCLTNTLGSMLQLMLIQIPHANLVRLGFANESEQRRIRYMLPTVSSEGIAFWLTGLSQRRRRKNGTKRGNSKTLPCWDSETKPFGGSTSELPSNPWLR